MLFNYLTFLIPQDELQAALTTHGLEGWRLHTCDAIQTTGAHGSGQIWIHVVMDQAYQEEEVDETIPEEALEGLKMKG